MANFWSARTMTMYEKMEGESTAPSTMETEASSAGREARRTGRGRSCQNRTEDAVARVFEAYGRWASRHPWLLIVGSLLVSVYMGTGLLRIEFITDTDVLYLPQYSQAWDDLDWLKEHYPDKSTQDFYPHKAHSMGQYIDVVGRAIDGGTVLRETIIDAVEAVHDMITSTVAEYDGKNYTYGMVCARREGECVVSGKVFWSRDFRRKVATNSVPFPVLLDPSMPIGIQVQDFLGAVRAEDRLLKSAGYFRLVWQLISDNQTAKNISTAFSFKVLDQLADYNDSRLELAYSMATSAARELEKTIGADIYLFVMTIVLMMVYASVIVTGTNCVASRGNLSKAGVLATILAVAAACGALLNFGLPMVQINGVMPFLIIGFGIDDMFVLMSGLAGCDRSAPLPERLAYTMRSSGLAITITTLTDVLAFFIGGLSGFVSVRNFCIYTGLSMLCCYVMMLTFFTGCMVLHERRVEASRHELTCMVVGSEEEMKAEGSGGLRVLCCAGEAPQSRDDTEGYCERAPRRFLSRLITKWPVKVVVIVGVLAGLGVACWGVTGFKKGLFLRFLVADDSYFYRYATWQEKNFVDGPGDPIMFVVKEPLDYWDSEVQHKIRLLMQNVRLDATVMGDLEINWLREYKDSPVYNDSSPEAFVHNLRYLFLPNAPFFHNDVVFDEQGRINSSRFYVRGLSSNDSQVNADAMLRMRELARRSELPVFPFTTKYIYNEQTVVIVRNTLYTVGTSGVAVLLVTLIFMPNLLLICYVTIAVGMIMVSLFGFMYFLGLTLSSITMVQIIMSVGFSIDYTAHICHAYQISRGKSRNERVRGAIEKIGGPILHGGLSSILGVSLLAFSKSYIFRSFFQIMLLVICLGLIQSFLFLPAILSLIGPMSGGAQDDDDDDEDGNATIFDAESGTKVTEATPVVAFKNGTAAYRRSLEKGDGGCLEMEPITDKSSGGSSRYTVIPGLTLTDEAPVSNGNVERLQSSDSDKAKSEDKSARQSKRSIKKTTSSAETKATKTPESWREDSGLKMDGISGEGHQAAPVVRNLPLLHNGVQYLLPVVATEAGLALTGVEGLTIQASKAERGADLEDSSVTDDTTASSQVSLVEASPDLSKKSGKKSTTSDPLAKEKTRRSSRRREVPEDVEPSRQEKSRPVRGSGPDARSHSQRRKAREEDDENTTLMRRRKNKSRPAEHFETDSDERVGVMNLGFEDDDDDDNVYNDDDEDEVFTAPRRSSQPNQYQYYTSDDRQEQARRSSREPQSKHPGVGDESAMMTKGGRTKSDPKQSFDEGVTDFRGPKEAKKPSRRGKKGGGASRDQDMEVTSIAFPQRNYSVPQGRPQGDVTRESALSPLARDAQPPGMDVARFRDDWSGVLHSVAAPTPSRVLPQYGIADAHEEDDDDDDDTENDDDTQSSSEQEIVTKRAY